MSEIRNSLKDDSISPIRTMAFSYLLPSVLLNPLKERLQYRLSERPNNFLLFIDTLKMGFILTQLCKSCDPITQRQISSYYIATDVLHATKRFISVIQVVRSKESPDPDATDDILSTRIEREEAWVHANKSTSWNYLGWDVVTAITVISLLKSMVL